MTDGIRIENGALIDPANNIDGEQKPLYIKNGVIADQAGEGATVIDASDCVVMAGGIDIHTHIFGPMADLARCVAREAGIGEKIPSVAVASQKYAEMGYTTIVDPAVYPLFAHKTHIAAKGAPIIDRCFLALIGPRVLLDEITEKGDFGELKDYIAWLVNGSGAYGIKVVDPRSVEEIKLIARAVTSLNLPHPVHLHLPHLGEGAGFGSAIETISALKGVEAHIAHMQFHCYKNIDGVTRSGARKIAEVIKKNKNITIDVGQLVFGKTALVSADINLIERIEGITEGKGKSLNAGFGEVCKAVRYTYDKRSYINSLGWIAGIELFLLIDDPWQVCLSTDHPNAGSFTAYPLIIKLLMDRDYRLDQLSKIHPKAIERSALKDISREYSLYEIAIITRAGPSKRLGLLNKGSLGIGGDADIAIYRKDSDIEKMFTRPAWVIKGGEVVAENGRVVKPNQGKTFCASLSIDEGSNAKWKERLEKKCEGGFGEFPIDKNALEGS